MRLFEPPIKELKTPTFMSLLNQLQSETVCAILGRHPDLINLARFREVWGNSSRVLHIH